MPFAFHRLVQTISSNTHCFADRQAVECEAHSTLRFSLPTRSLLRIALAAVRYPALLSGTGTSKPFSVTDTRQYSPTR